MYLNELNLLNKPSTECLTLTWDVFKVDQSKIKAIKEMRLTLTWDVSKFCFWDNIRK